VKKFITKFKYPLAEVLTGKKDQQWTVFWFPIELMGLNRAMAIRIDLETNGNYRAKHAYFWKFDKI